MKLTPEQEEQIVSFMSITGWLCRDIPEIDKREECYQYLNMCLVKIIPEYNQEFGMSLKSWVFLKLKLAKKDFWRLRDKYTRNERKSGELPNRVIISLNEREVKEKREEKSGEINGIEIPDEELGYERILDIDEAKRIVEKIKEILSERHFNILFDACVNEKTSKEIAKQYGISSATIDGILRISKLRIKNGIIA